MCYPILVLGGYGNFGRRIAARRNVVVISGASSVPGLSSAVVDEFLPRFSKLTHIRHGVTPGNRAERGDATVRAILSYTGRPLRSPPSRP